MNSTKLTEKDFKLIKKKLLQKVFYNDSNMKTFKKNPKSFIKSIAKDLYPNEDFSNLDNISIIVIDETDNNMVIRLPDISKGLPEVASTNYGCWDAPPAPPKDKKSQLELKTILEYIASKFTEKVLLDDEFKKQLLEHHDNAIDFFEKILYETWPKIKISESLREKLNKMKLTILDCPKKNTYYDIDVYEDAEELIDVGVENKIIGSFKETLHHRYYIMPK